MPGKVPSWYVDTCILASLVKREELQVDDVPRWKWSQLLLEKAEREEVVLFTSAFTLAELHGGTGETSKQVLDKIAEIFDAEILVPVTLSVDIALNARDLIWDLRRGRSRRELKGPDAIHLASALAGGCSKLITWDDRDFIKLNGLVPGITFSSPNQVIAVQQAELGL